MGLKNNSDCEFKKTWTDELGKIAIFCELRNKLVPWGICKICEKREKFYKGNKQ